MIIMTWKDEIKKRKMFVRRNLADEAKQFLKDVEENLDRAQKEIEDAFSDYPEYDRKDIEKVVKSTIKEAFDGIKINLKTEQVILNGLVQSRK